MAARTRSGVTGPGGIQRTRASPSCSARTHGYRFAGNSPVETSTSPRARLKAVWNSAVLVLGASTTWSASGRQARATACFAPDASRFSRVVTVPGPGLASSSSKLAAVVRTAFDSGPTLAWSKYPTGSVNWFRYSGEIRSEEHTSELQSRENLVCRLLLKQKDQL